MYNNKLHTFLIQIDLILDIMIDLTRTVHSDAISVSNQSSTVSSTFLQFCIQTIHTIQAFR